MRTFIRRWFMSRNKVGVSTVVSLRVRSPSKYARRKWKKETVSISGKEYVADMRGRNFLVDGSDKGAR